MGMPFTLDVIDKEEEDYDSDYEDCKDAVSHEEYLELKRKYKLWVNSFSTVSTGLFDTSEAFKLKLSHLSYIHSLAEECRNKMVIHTFTAPSQPWAETSMIFYEGAQVKDPYVECARLAIHEYNSVINKPDKLKLVSMLKINMATGMFFELFMTFTALDSDTGLIGTYQAAAAGHFYNPNYYPTLVRLVFLRHVEADKVLAIGET